VLVRRDTREKSPAPLAGLGAHVLALLERQQGELLERARQFMAQSTTKVESWDEFKRVMSEKRGFILAGWCGDAEVEARIKAETKATIRVMPMGEPVAAPCVYSGKPGHLVYFAQAY